MNINLTRSCIYQKFIFPREFGAENGSKFEKKKYYYRITHTHKHLWRSTKICVHSMLAAAICPRVHWMVIANYSEWRRHRILVSLYICFYFWRLLSVVDYSEMFVQPSMAYGFSNAKPTADYRCDLTLLLSCKIQWAHAVCIRFVEIQHVHLVCSNVEI